MRHPRPVRDTCLYSVCAVAPATRGSRSGAPPTKFGHMPPHGLSIWLRSEQGDVPNVEISRQIARGRQMLQDIYHAPRAKIDLIPHGIALPDILAEFPEVVYIVLGATHPNELRFHNHLSFDRRWLDERGSEDCQGRALWALGLGVGRSPFGKFSDDGRTARRTAKWPL